MEKEEEDAIRERKGEPERNEDVERKKKWMREKRWWWIVWKWDNERK